MFKIIYSWLILEENNHRKLRTLSLGFYMATHVQIPSQWVLINSYPFRMECVLCYHLLNNKIACQLLFIVIFALLISLRKVWKKVKCVLYSVYIQRGKTKKKRLRMLMFKECVKFVNLWKWRSILCLLVNNYTLPPSPMPASF